MFCKAFLQEFESFIVREYFIPIKKNRLIRCWQTHYRFVERHAQLSITITDI